MSIRRFWTQERLSKLNEYRLKGYSYNRIKYLLGAASPVACRSAARTYKIPAREYQRTKEQVENLHKLIVVSCGFGIGDQQLADKFKVSRTTILHVRKKYGIPPGHGWGGKRIKNPQSQGTNPKV